MDYKPATVSAVNSILCGLNCFAAHTNLLAQLNGRARPQSDN